MKQHCPCNNKCFELSKACVKTSNDGLEAKSCDRVSSGKKKEKSKKHRSKSRGKCITSEEGQTNANTLCANSDISSSKSCCKALEKCKESCRPSKKHRAKSSCKASEKKADPQCSSEIRKEKSHGKHSVSC
nr:unnamed protein product [Spirometra erinaceieuropaei]